ncbi:hypothetical protein [Noviherbaspirillum pedocola]|uniref:Uncharacterized protein n=1 Tax=Noviherbaspirillum pedocola TaxID=2801341 RepID=A0A934SWT3_9BURK|nr:hypothetical protein [Noviherbaspirillum pedocola]MBK4736805.1 hypothetical protein [Noviherbaspirillum pedocola]
MALIKNVTKPERTVRVAFGLKEGQVRKFHAYRLFIESKYGYLPSPSEMAELLFAHIFGEDKEFVGWYSEKDTAQAASIDALMKKDAAKPQASQKDEGDDGIAL